MNSMGVFLLGGLAYSAVFCVSLGRELDLRRSFGRALSTKQQATALACALLWPLMLARALVRTGRGE